MKKFLYLFLLTFVSLFSLCAPSYAQQINAIQSKCPSGNALIFSSVRLLADGNIAYTPCDTFSSIFYGNVDFSNATIIGSGFVTGTGTTNFIPRFTGASAIGNTPMSWNGTSYVLSNTALTSDWRITFTPNDTTGFFGVGNYTTAQSNFFTLTESTGIFSLKSSGSILGNSPTVNLGDITGSLAGMRLDISNLAQTVKIGDTDGIGNGNYFIVDDATETITLNTNETRIENQFAVAAASDCAGTGTLSGGGTVTITLTDCVVDGSSLFFVSYDNTSIANVLPLSATRVASDLAVRGDANATFSYWIINRY